MQTIRVLALLALMPLAACSRADNPAQGHTGATHNVRTMARSLFGVLAFCFGVGFGSNVVLAQSTAAAEPLSACALLTKTEIKNLGGGGNPYFDQIPGSEETLRNGGSECSYAGLAIALDHLPLSDFEAMRTREMERGVKFVPVSGVGNEAYLFEANVGKDWHTVGIYGKVGQHVLAVILDVDPPATAESLRPGLVALAKAAAAKLR